MNCKMRKIIMVLGVTLCSVLMTSCGDGSEKSLQSAENMIVQSNDFNSALNVLNTAIEKNSDNEDLTELKDEITTYLNAKDSYYKKSYEEAIEYLDELDEKAEGTVMEEPSTELRERIKKQTESKKKSESSKSAYYLEGADFIIAERADFSIEQAFEVFEPYEEVSENEEEFKYLLSIPSRSEEEETRLNEIKGTILGASTISSNVYADDKGIFRIGSQHYLFSSTGERIINKVYKNGTVERVN